MILACFWGLELKDFALVLPRFCKMKKVSTHVKAHILEHQMPKYQSLDHKRYE